MSWRRAVSKLWGLFASERRDVDLEDEIRLHIEMEAQDNREAGMPSGEAHSAALRRFGNLTQTRERSREMWGWNLLDSLGQDLRYGMRQLGRAPGFTLAAVLTLALGIGANTAIFSVVNAVVLRPLPYPDAGRLVVADLINPRDPQGLAPYGVLDYQAAHSRQKAFDAFAAATMGAGSFVYTGESEPVHVRGTAVTAEFFQALSVAPLLGRTFAKGDDAPGHPRQVVLSHAFWQQHFASNPAAIGRSITLDGASYTIAGVMPPAFHFGERDDDELWPLFQLAPTDARYPFFLLSIGRLKPGVSEEQGREDLSRIAAEVQRQFPNTDLSAVHVQPLKAQIVTGDINSALLTLLGAVGLVLLIAVVNVANLQLARTTARDREMAIRSAMGAGRFRISRQLLVESLMLALCGGALGLFLAYGGVRILLALDPGGVPRLKEIAVDSSMLLFTCGVSVVSGLLFGLAPSLFGFRGSTVEALHGGAQNLSEQRQRRGLRNALVALEVASSVVLLSGAGLLLRSFERLSHTSPGFNPQPLVTGMVALPESRYPANSHIVSFYDRLLERVASLPGVASASVSMSLPPDLLSMRNPFWVPSLGPPAGKSLPGAVELTVSPSYFSTLGIPLLRGRLFDNSDRSRNDPILIVNQTFARRYFPSVDPIGQRIKTGSLGPNTPWETIAGVVADVKYSGLDTPPEPTLYVPYFQAYWPAFSREMFLVARAQGDPAGMAGAMRSAVLSLDRQIPLANVHSMPDLLAGSVAKPRFRLLLLGVFAGLALILAAIGIYGVMSYLAGRRKQEIGVRMALGASRSDLVRMMVGQGLGMVAIGIAAGLAAWFALSGIVQSWLFGVQPADPLTFVVAPLVVAGVGIVASYIPARRATQVDPLAPLRCD